MSKKNQVDKPKLNIFKRGDVIVSGYGNIRIFTGECFKGDSWKSLTPYCTSDFPAGTDMRFARKATDREKKKFFEVLKRNGFKFDRKTLTVSDTDESLSRDSSQFENAKGRWKVCEPTPYKVVEKRLRATLTQLRKAEHERDLAYQNFKAADNENVELRNSVVKLKTELESLTEKCRLQLAADEDLAKQVQELKAQLKNEQDLHIHFAKECDDLKKENEGFKRANEQLNRLNDQHIKNIEELRNRGFWARLFNL